MCVATQRTAVCRPSLNPQLCIHTASKSKPPPVCTPVQGVQACPERPATPGRTSRSRDHGMKLVVCKHLKSYPTCAAPPIRNPWPLSDSACLNWPTASDILGIEIVGCHRQASDGQACAREASMLPFGAVSLRQPPLHLAMGLRGTPGRHSPDGLHNGIKPWLLSVGGDATLAAGRGHVLFVEPGNRSSLRISWCLISCPWLRSPTPRQRHATRMGCPRRSRRIPIVTSWRSHLSRDDGQVWPGWKGAN